MTFGCRVQPEGWQPLPVDSDFNDSEELYNGAFYRTLRSLASNWTQDQPESGPWSESEHEMLPGQQSQALNQFQASFTQAGNQSATSHSSWSRHGHGHSLKSQANHDDAITATPIATMTMATTASSASGSSTFESTLPAESQ